MLGLIKPLEARNPINLREWPPILYYLNMQLLPLNRATTSSICFQLCSPSPVNQLAHVTIATCMALHWLPAIVFSLTAMTHILPITKCMWNDFYHVLPPVASWCLWCMNPRYSPPRCNHALPPQHAVRQGQCYTTAYTSKTIEVYQCSAHVLGSSRSLSTQSNASPHISPIWFFCQGVAWYGTMDLLP